MRLDPYLSARLRTHRAYLLRQALRRLTGSLARMRGYFRLHPASAEAPLAAGPSTAASAFSVPPDTASGPSKARARHRRAARAWDRDELKNAGTPGPDLPIEEHFVPVDGYPDVRVRVYRPSADGRSRPGVLHFFGGGFRIGGIDYPTTDAACRRRAAEADVVVVAVDYALAPEHRYPTQVEQGHAALEWLARSGAELGVDVTRIALSGTSAGGGIAAAVALMNRDRRAHAVRLQVLEVPVTDLTGRHIDFVPTWRMGVPALLVLRELRSIARTYLGDTSRAREPYASPLRAADHAGLPPTLIVTAEYDNLRRDGAAYGQALRRAGVEATVVRYLGVGHDTPIYTGVLPASRTWHEQIVTALRGLHD